MFFESFIRGDRLPPRTLCLTYDDGPGTPDRETDPGPRTAELGAYLHALGVPAAFFVVGRCAAHHSVLLRQLAAQGHLIANHTFDHPSLPAFLAQGGDVAAQLASTHQEISHLRHRGPRLFRPPYGDWRIHGQPRSNVAAALNRTSLATAYAGPVGWDIDAGDVGFWRDDRSAGECAHAYLSAVHQAGRGIVLMHDSTADIDSIRRNNRALPLAQSLLPELLRRGYTFVRLDRVPQVMTAMRVSFQATLIAPEGQVVLSGPARSAFNGKPDDMNSLDLTWGIVDLGRQQWALRAANGLYLSVRRESVTADATEAGRSESFEIVRFGHRGVAFRTADRKYLTYDTSGEHSPDRIALKTGPETIFSVSNPFASSEPNSASSASSERPRDHPQASSPAALRNCTTADGDGPAHTSP